MYLPLLFELPKPRRKAWRPVCLGFGDLVNCLSFIREVPLQYFLVTRGIFPYFLDESGETFFFSASIASYKYVRITEE